MILFIYLVISKLILIVEITKCHTNVQRKMSYVIKYQSVRWRQKIPSKTNFSSKNPLYSKTIARLVQPEHVYTYKKQNIKRNISFKKTIHRYIFLFRI